MSNEALWLPSTLIFHMDMSELKTFQITCFIILSYTCEMKITP